MTTHPAWLQSQNDQNPAGVSPVCGRPTRGRYVCLRYEERRSTRSRQENHGGTAYAS